MSTNKRSQLAQGVQCVFEILNRHPEGLTGRQLQQQLTNNSCAGFNPLAHHTFEELTLSCIAAMKAGWLIVERNRWSLSDIGRKAYDDYKQPQELISQAGKLSVQGWLALNFPGIYSFAGKTKDQITSEVRAVRRIGLSKLLSDTLGEVEEWEKVLPLQSPLTFDLSDSQVDTQLFFDRIKTNGSKYKEGGHAIYLPPKSFRSTLLKSVADNYPTDAGLKIVKNEGGVDESSYVSGSAKGDSIIHRGMIHGHRKLSLVANLLHLQGVGPRLYDVVNLKCGTQMWAGYVIQDVGETIPSADQCEQGLLKLREMDASGLLKVILPDGFADEEFECPHCSGNAFVDQLGKFQYIDFQNFRLGDYEAFLLDLATRAAEQSHFGDTLLLRGKRYLYQSVPGVRLPAKRDIANRLKVLSGLLAEAKVSIKNRLVLDVGCNIGMMMGQYLKLGAKWCHGWDRPLVISNTERMLLALGCTRFSTTGTELTPTHSLAQDLPLHARSSLSGCAISYLAVRGHLDWLADLGRLPWSFMIYEGHEGETLDDLKEHLKDLAKLTDVTLGPATSYVDGDSEERIVAIIMNSRERNSAR